MERRKRRAGARRGREGGDGEPMNKAVAMACEKEPQGQVRTRRERIRKSKENECEASWQNSQRKVEREKRAVERAEGKKGGILFSSPP